MDDKLREMEQLMCQVSIDEAIFDFSLALQRELPSLWRWTMSTEIKYGRTSTRF